jgi:hypothetical protein
LECESGVRSSRTLLSSLPKGKTGSSYQANPSGPTLAKNLEHCHRCQRRSAGDPTRNEPQRKVEFRTRGHGRHGMIHRHLRGRHQRLQPPLNPIRRSHIWSMRFQSQRSPAQHRNPREGLHHRKASQGVLQTLLPQE